MILALLAFLPYYTLADLGPATDWADTSTLASGQGLGGGTTTVWATNAFGDACGDSTLVDESQRHAVLWVQNLPTDLGSLGGSSSAYALNIVDQVVGESLLPDNRRHGFLWEAGTMLDVTPYALDAVATGINDGGTFVGTMDGTGFVSVFGKPIDVNMVIHDAPGYLIYECDSIAYDSTILARASTFSGDRMVTLTLQLVPGKLPTISAKGHQANPKPPPN